MIDSARVESRAPRALTSADIASLHASLDPAVVSAEAARVLVEVTGAASCALWTADAGTTTALAAAGPEGLRSFAGRRVARPAAFDDAIAARRPVVVPSIAGAALVAGEDDPIVLLALPRAMDVPAVAALGAPATVHDLGEVARSAGAALGNAFEIAEARTRVERLEVLHDLGAALVEAGGTEALLERLNRLLRGRGIEVEGLAWRSRALTRRVGGSEPTAQERALLRDGGVATTLADGRLAVAVRTGDEALGSMRVRAAGDPDELPFLELVAAGVAEVAARMSLRAEVEEASRGAALANERDRIAASLHDTAGQLFVAIRLLARREAEQLP
ncbi:MAG TPA: hypothetical protein VEV43_14250, partial [Actinomycetota bacterium]|nr:hypothetical protein [Actinomycetota bacterium]